MKVISFVSLKGGVGRTTVTAHLGSILARDGRRCLLFDLDPLNSLGHWYGMSPGERQGIARGGDEPDTVLSYVRRTTSEASYMPFGTFNESELMELDKELIANPGWLKKRLNMITPTDYDVVILDTAAGFGHWTRQALAVSDLVVVVMLPEASSYITIPALKDILDAYCTHRKGFKGFKILLNQFDARRELDRNVRMAVMNIFGDAVLPVTVPYDGSVRESLAQQQTLFQTYPDSQVIVSVTHIAELLMASLSDEPPASESDKA